MGPMPVLEGYARGRDRARLVDASMAKPADAERRALKVPPEDGVPDRGTINASNSLKMEVIRKELAPRTGLEPVTR